MPEHTCPLSKPPPAAEGFSTAPCSEDVVCHTYHGWQAWDGLHGVLDLLLGDLHHGAVLLLQRQRLRAAPAQPGVHLHGDTQPGLGQKWGTGLTAVTTAPSPTARGDFNQPPWKWLQSGSVLSYLLPPTRTMARPESSLEHFDNMSCLEHFYFLSCMQQSKAPCSCCLSWDGFLAGSRKEALSEGMG